MGCWSRGSDTIHLTGYNNSSSSASSIATNPEEVELAANGNGGGHHNVTVTVEDEGVPNTATNNQSNNMNNNNNNNNNNNGSTENSDSTNTPANMDNNYNNSYHIHLQPPTSNGDATRRKSQQSMCDEKVVEKKGGWNNAARWVRHHALTRKVLYKRLPLVGWLSAYSRGSAIADLLAGVTVGLTVIPQAIAYANVAGLPPQYGLYSSFVGCFVYAIFGSVKDSPIGPTAIMAILTRENLHDMGPQGAVVLAFITGCIQLIMGILQLGFLIDFISGPVSVGFTSAAAIIIATSQVKDLLGLSYSASSFIDVWDQLALHISETRLWDALLGFTCMTILLILRKVKDIPVGPQGRETACKRILSQTLWFVSTARNILVVVVCAVMAYMFHQHGSIPFVLSGHVKEGLPHIHLPPFQINVNEKTYTFLDMCTSFGSAIVILPLLSILEDISLAKVFSDGKSIDATQEMMALGMCNVASSFFGSMPVSGALSRGAVNNASGVQTTLGGIYTGLIVIVSLQFFTPYFYYIPKASLAAVIIAAVVFMVEFHVVKPIWKTNKMDLIPAAATFVSCLLIRLELGIVIGIGTNVLFLLYASARPSVHVEKHTTDWGCEYLMITPDRSLVFPSVEYVRNLVRKAGVRQGSSCIPVVIDSRHVQGADFTAAKGVKLLIEDFVKRDQPLLFYNLKPSVVEVFQGVQPVRFQHCSSETQLYSMLRGYKRKPSHVPPPT